SRLREAPVTTFANVAPSGTAWPSRMADAPSTRTRLPILVIPSAARDLVFVARKPVARCARDDIPLDAPRNCHPIRRVDLSGAGPAPSQVADRPAVACDVDRPLRRARRRAL